MQNADVHFTYESACRSLRAVLVGEIDVATAPRLFERIEAAFKQYDAVRLVMLLDQVSFFGAAGMHLVRDLRAHVPGDVHLHATEGTPARRLLDLFHHDDA
jgi:anti-anti-sigma factor